MITNAPFYRLRRIALPVLVAAAAALLLVGCDHQTGIFASLERESEILNRNLPDNVSVAGVARAGEHYFAAVGSVWVVSGSLEEAETNWKRVDPPGGDDAGWIALSLAGMEDTLYAAFQDADATYRGVYSYTADTDDGEWSDDPVYDGDVAELFAFDTDEDGVHDTLVGVRGVTGEDVAPQSYEVVFDLTGSPTVAGSDPENDPLRLNAVVDATYHADDGEYWIITRDDLYKGPDPSTLAKQELTGNLEDLEGLEAAPPFAGLHYDEGDLFVTTRDGDLYRRLAGGGDTWEKVEITESGPLGKPVALPGVGDAEPQLYIPALTTDDNGGGGYFVMAPDGESASRPTDDPSYVSAEISTAAVTAFHLFPRTTEGPYELFALTADTGLWSRTVDPDMDPDTDDGSGLSNVWRWE
ncbi:MAG: hypothetical protein ACOCYG_01400 [Spirochaetota bacterium]